MVTIDTVLRDLRKLFPEFRMRVITVYDPEPGLPYTTISLAIDDDHDPARAFSGNSLSDCMARVYDSQKEQ